MEQLGVPVHLILKYVDDVLVITSKAEKGTRYREGRLTRDKADVEADRERTEEDVTMQLLADVASDIFSFLKFSSSLSWLKMSL